MKVLYIGNYKDGTGWGNAAANYILALDSVGVDVVPRTITFNGGRAEVSPRLLELEQKSIVDCDVCIQHVLPHYMMPDGRFKKSIGLYATETDNFTDMGWSTFLNNMDELWCPNHNMMGAARNSGVTTPMQYIPHTFDISKYTQSYNKLPLRGIDGNFVFYWIGEFVQRKNLLAALIAFHTEFNSNEPVSLVIKTSMPGVIAPVCHQQVLQLCKYVKERLKLYHHIEDYMNEIIIADRFSEDQIMSLHTTGDCLISTSYGEAWNIPAFDAMAMNKPVITNTVDGVSEFITHEQTGILVKNRPETVFGVTDSFTDLYTANEKWYNIDITDLRQYMRKVYADAEYRRRISQGGLDRAMEFNYQKVGNKMKECLNANYN